MTKKDEKITGVALLRQPFPAHQISKLPKPTKQQTEEVKLDFRAGRRCTICGAWHHPDVVHLDYVGHAALTDRLLDADEKWDWEPLALDQDGLPRFDKNGGLWIKLTVCGITRKGYGHPDGKTGGDAVKETIGDALRNAAMRFGAALDLWHKGDLHQDEPKEEKTQQSPLPEQNPVDYLFAHSSGLLQAEPGGVEIEVGKKVLGKKISEVAPETLEEMIDYFFKLNGNGQRSIKTNKFLINAYQHLINGGYLPPRKETK